ncbi:MAG TPA: alpha/beta hydrolase [Clostridiaceae bacterium]|nr:alpha/beta hydrolase [Clostridiaceae bacterium]
MILSNKLIMGALWLLHFLNPPTLDVDAIYAHAKKHNERQVFKIPRGRGIDYDDLSIHTEIDSYHCLRMKRKGHKPERAVLYICGGGGVYDYCQAQLVLAKRLLRRVDADIYYPFYPPATKNPIRETYRMIFETYRAMLKHYSNEQIGVLGLSFGATAAMTMISWNNFYEENLPMPAVTIGLSPGHVPACQDEKDMLETYRGIDPFIPVEWIDAFGHIQKGGVDLDHWMIHTCHGDFRNAGEIYLYYGEKESLVYAAPIYEKSLKRSGAKYQIHIELGMPHCYGIGRINKATRTTYDEIVGLLNEL